MAAASPLAPSHGPLGPEALDGSHWDEGLGFRTIVGEIAPGAVLLQLIAERIRVAAGHLRLSREDLYRIFSRHSVFEGETRHGPGVASSGFILVETHHLIQGRVGKGALKLVFPEDLLGKGDHFREVEPGVIEVMPPAGRSGWDHAGEAEELVKGAMRELMTAESLSMSLKSQATDAPFAGSEGLMLCAVREFEATTGRYRLRAALQGGDDHLSQDKELVERMMNDAAAMLTQARRIGYDRIVHAPETNTTLTARLSLQLPANAVEGHVRTLLESDPGIIIGDEDMTTRLRELLERKRYTPTACTLVRAAARMQLDHAILLPASRERLRQVLESLPGEGAPTSGQYRALMDLFFGTGPTQQEEDRRYHHREAILRALSLALSVRCLDECGEASVLGLYLRTLLDNQWIMLERALTRLLAPGQALPVGWYQRHLLLSAADQQTLAGLVPTSNLSREEVRETFWGIVKLLCDARDQVPAGLPELQAQARTAVLERAIRAITVAGDVVPTTDRLLFFTLPLAYECATPRLGVVTRKPVELCGSELRPEAMAQGALVVTETFLKAMTGQANPFQGLTVAIEGLGNAGKNVASLLVAAGARVVGVSDSRGALTSPTGFSRQELAAIIAHKNAGKRFDTFLNSAIARLLARNQTPSLAYHANPEALKRTTADILVLTAIPASLHRDNAGDLPVKIVCELTGAAVTREAKQILRQRGIEVIPDNLASSGGLLVSLSEMLQNSTGQVWDRQIEHGNLRDQLERSCSAVRETARLHDVDLATASDILALQRMHNLALYREALEDRSAQLTERIRSIRPGERVLVLSDNDEDGVASAAVLHALIAHFNPGAEQRILHLNESLRSAHVPELLRHSETDPQPIRHLFALDRAVPLAEPGRTHLAEVAARCRVTFVNNHRLPDELLETTAPGGRADSATTLESLNVLCISAQTLRSPVPLDEFPTALVLREVAGVSVSDERVLNQIAWQAAVGCCLDAPPQPRSEWLLFYSRFNPDRTVEAARAVRLVTRARGYRNAIQALVSVERPEQLETQESWGRFVAGYQALNERVQVLVERIVSENRGRPYTAHFFTPDEVASPTPLAGDELRELDFYHWISEPLTERGDLAERPIIVGQVVTDFRLGRCLGVRIRSPRGVDLMQAGLPAEFVTGGLANTAIARVPLPSDATPAHVFTQLVDAIWSKPVAAGGGSSLHEPGL